MTDLPQLQAQLLQAATRRSRRRRWAVLVPRVAAAAALAVLAAVMLAPREPAAPERSSGGASLARLAALVPAFDRPERKGDRPRWPGAAEGSWRLLGRREGRRGWLGLVPAGREGPERLCLVADLRPIAEEGVDCRPAAGRLDGRSVLAAMRFGTRRQTIAVAAVPPRAELVVFTRPRGAPVAAAPTRDGLVVHSERAAISGLQLRGPDGVMVTETFGFRQRGIPAGLVDVYAAWRRPQAARDRRPVVVSRSPGPSTWGMVGEARLGVAQWMSWTGRSLCLYVIPSGARLGGATCVPQDEAYGGVLRTEAERAVHVLALPDRVESVDVVRAGGGADRYEVRDNGVAIPARRGDRELRLLDAEGMLLRTRRL